MAHALTSCTGNVLLVETMAVSWQVNIERSRDSYNDMFLTWYKMILASFSLAGPSRDAYQTNMLHGNQLTNKRGKDFVSSLIASNRCDCCQLEKRSYS